MTRLRRGNQSKSQSRSAEEVRLQPSIQLPPVGWPNVELLPSFWSYLDRCHYIVANLVGAESYDPIQ